MKEIKENFILRLFIQSSHYVVGTLGVMLAGFISLPILTRIFSRSEYGILSLISITLWIILAFSKAGMGESAVRFYSEFNNGKRKEAPAVYYSTLLLSGFVLAIVMSFILWFVVNSFSINLFGPDTSNFIYLFMLMIITGTILTRVINFFRAAQSTKMYNLMNVIRRYLSVGLGIAFLFAINRDLQSFYKGIILAEIIIILILGYNLVREDKIKLNSFSWTFFSESLLFGFPLIINELAGFLLQSTNRYLIQFFLGSDSVGVYSLGSDLCMYVKDALAHPLYYAVVPLYLELWNNKGLKQTEEFLTKVLNYYTLIAIPVMFGFIALSKPIVITLASVKFVESTSVIPYILPGSIFWGYYPIITAGLYIYKQTKKIGLLTFMGVGFNIGLNIIFIPKLQLQGAALATLVTYIILTIVLMKMSSGYLKIRISPGKLTKIVFSSAIMFIAIKNISIRTNIISLLVYILLGVIVYGCMMILIEKDFRELIFNTLKTQILKISKYSFYVRNSN